MKDAARKKRTSSLHGESSALSKLTWREVCEIRLSSFTQQKEVAAWYGVSQRTVSLIRRWEIWKYPNAESFYRANGRG
ncbi:MAG TPA: hypothetical protein VJ044_04325, partial [Candidatus Hodarchaeales archaeon]|nr:hypothetical protein [Candidatus Hodarchaeales archaeon]